MTFYQLVSWVIKAQEQFPEYRKELIQIVTSSFTQHDVEAKLADIITNISNLKESVNNEKLSAELDTLLRYINKNPNQLTNGMNLLFAMRHTVDSVDLLYQDKLQATKNVGLRAYVGDEFKITGSDAGGSEQFRSDFSRRACGLNGQYSIGCKTKADKADSLNPDFAKTVTRALANVLKLDVNKDAALLQAFYKAYSQDLMGLTYSVYGGAVVGENDERADDVLVRVGKVIMNNFAYMHQGELYFRIDSASGFDVMDMAAVNAEEKFIAGKARYTYKLINVETPSPQFQLVKVESDNPVITRIFSGEVVPKNYILDLATPKSAMKDLGFNLADCYYGLTHANMPEDLQLSDVKATLKSPEFYLSQLSNHAMMLETKELITNPREIHKYVAHLPPFDTLALGHINVTEDQINRHNLLNELYQQVDCLSDSFLNQIRGLSVTHQFYFLSAMLALEHSDWSQATRQYLNNLDERHFPYFYATMIQSMPSKPVSEDLLSYNDGNGLIDETYSLIQEVTKAESAKQKTQAVSVHEDLSSSEDIIIREAPAVERAPVATAAPAAKRIPSWLQRALFVGAMMLGAALIAAAAAATSGLILVPLAVMITGFVLGGVITAGGIAGLVQNEVRQANKRQAEDRVIDATYTRSISPDHKRQKTSSGHAAPRVSRYSFLASDNANNKVAQTETKRLR